MSIRKKIRGICAVAVLSATFLAGCGGEKSPDLGTSFQADLPIQSDGTDHPGQDGERITLTLGTIGNRNLQNVVDAYNRQSEKYFVEIVDYLPEQYDNAVWEASADRFRMDVATGNGTDIIDLDQLDVEVLGCRGILMDLEPFLEGTQERYLTNILECLKTGDALYELGPSFALYTVVGNGAEVGMENGWTLEEMMKCFADKGRDSNALTGFGSECVSTALTNYLLEDFIDWEKGEADFCKEEFYQILRFGAKWDAASVSKISVESIKSGTHLAAMELILSVAGYQQRMQLFGGNMAVKGIPCNSGTGVAVSLYYEMGINAHSECAEGAWDFLRFYTEGSWAEDDWTIIGFRIERNAFEKQLEQAMVQEYYEGSPLPKGSFDDPDVPYVYAATQEEVAAVRELVALADRKDAYNRIIRNIIDEEVGAYNSGAQTVEQTAQKIQNRVQLYLDEQR
ncbi:MAG: hypothetical protein K2I22_08905 [Lachnospiraceae bacterium]|nr:hypothetical protein [Lachnospiraceae bacterium]